MRIFSCWKIPERQEFSESTSRYKRLNGAIARSEYWKVERTVAERKKTQCQQMLTIDMKNTNDPERMLKIDKSSVYEGFRTYYESGSGYIFK